MPEDKVIPVRVALRCRPLIPKEENEGCQKCLKFVPEANQVILGKEKAFTYDYVFTPETPQVIVYEQAVQKLVKGIFKGYNATVLAYGQTGSGKTYSMGGGYGVCTDAYDEVNGVIPRVIRDLYEGIEERKEDYDFIVKVSYIELYKEDLIDLLAPVTSKDRDCVQIREETNGGIRLVGHTEKLVTSMDETLQCLDLGAKSRTTGATAMNSQSSRSHAIFTIIVDKKSIKHDNDECSAKFHLVDLAGSERAKKTQAEGERFKEGVNINKGLLALGNVISALGDEVTKNKHIPYRDSKLTRLLQDSLGGNSHTVMVACVSPADSNMEETLSTLRYADRARKIKNKPVVNRDPQAAEIMRLRQLVQDYQIQLIQGGKNPMSMSTSTMSSVADNTAELNQLMEKMKELESEKTKAVKDLRMQLAQNTVLMEQNINLEMHNEKLVATLNIVKEKTGFIMSMSRLETTQSLGGRGDEEEAHDVTSIIKEIHQHINETQHNDRTFAMSTIAEGDAGSTTRPCIDGSPCNETQSDEEQMSKQEEFQRRLVELNDQLLKKESVVKQMLQNDEAMDQMKAKYEEDKTKLQQQIESLSVERTNLLQEMENLKHSAASSKIAEQRRKRLKELEEELTKAKKTLKEQSKVVKMKEQSDHQLKKMMEEIREMKSKRIKLVKQMKEEAETFRKFKQDKDKEVMQLKAKDRKRQVELANMQRTNQQQQLVLRRKAEEAAAANKRLKEALMRQKSVQDERNKKQETNDMSGIGARVRKWLTHELEVLVSVEDAKRHLEGLKNDRADLVKQKKDLEAKLEDGPSPCKRKMSNDRTPDDSINEERLKEERNLLLAEIDLRSAQISDLQEKVMDAGQDEKKSRWHNVHTMVEAKCAMKYLLNEAVNARLEESKVNTQLSDVKEQYEEAIKSIDEYKKTLDLQKSQNQQEVLQLQRTYENKMLFLMNQLKNNSNLDSTQDDELRKRLQFQDKQIEKLMKFQDELELKTSECEQLKKELTRANYNLTLGRDGKLMPDIGSDGLAIKHPRIAETQNDSRFFSPVLTKKKSYLRKNALTSAQLLDYETDLETEDETTDVTDHDESDPDWHSGQTPGLRRPSRTMKRKTMTFKRASDTSPRSTTDFDEPPQVTVDNRLDLCTCKGRCIRNCCCRESNRGCHDKCGCRASKCSNREAVPPLLDEEEDSSNTMNTTFNIGVNTSTPLNSFIEPSDSRQDLLENITIPALNENSSRPIKKKSLEKNPSTSCLKENKDDKDPLTGGVKKKRKLQGKAYFPQIKP